MKPRIQCARTQWIPVSLRPAEADRHDQPKQTGLTVLVMSM
jgi:hypothetical protein